MHLRRRLSRHSADIVMASLLSVVAFGSPWPIPAILLAIKLNAFAVPIAVFTPVFGFPLWVWYVIGLLWSSQLLHYSGADLRETLPTARQRVLEFVRSDGDRPAVGPVGVRERDRDQDHVVLEHGEGEAGGFTPTESSD